MSNLKIKIFFILIVGLVYSSSILQPALSQSNFERIPVTMYRLVDAEEAISLRRTAGSVHPNWTLCTQGATLYGCTTLDGGPYPYDRSTIEVPFENVYLPNVLAQEMGSDYFPQAAKDAQAIAARTYALHLWDQYNEIKRRYDAGDDNWKPVPINNSTQFQALFQMPLMSLVVVTKTLVMGLMQLLVDHLI